MTPITKLEDFNDTMCVLPWCHFQTNASGDAHLCCFINDWSKNSSFGNIYKDSVEDIVNHEYIRNVRVQMMNGEWPDICSRCKTSQQNGSKEYLKFGSNMRLFGDDFLKTFNTTDANGFIDPSTFKMLRWNMKFSNHCNFGCRMCSTGNSSFIALEEKNKSRIFKIDDDRTRVWQIYIDRFAADAKAFYITGGEPMIMQDHWMLLDELIKIGKTDTLLQYNINASTLAYKDKHIFDYWDKFSNVKVHCSIDIHEHYAEYVRYGTKWETVLRNLHEIENYFGELHLNTVVTVYTFTHFLEFVDYLEKNFHNVQLHVSLCYGPGWLNPMILPEHIKREHVKLYVEHDYSQLKHVNVVGTELFKNILSKNIKHTQDADSSTLELRKQFIDQTTKYDKIRNQSFESVFDDVYKIVFDERFLTDDKY